MDLQVIGIVLSVILGFSATVTSSMVLFNLNSMKQRIVKLEVGQEKLIERKNQCNQDYPSQLAYIRTSNNLEEGMKQLIEKVAVLGGSMKALEQMPAICGNIAKEIVKEMRLNG